MPARYFQGETVHGSVVSSMADTFADVVETLREGARLRVTRRTFFAMDKKGRDQVKMVPFFTPAVFRFSPSKRKYEHALHCNLIFLDIDEAPPDPAFLQEALKEFNFFAYYTASSTPQKPRMRVVVDAQEIPIADYPRAVATIGTLLQLPSITRESAVAVQPMFFPTVFKDSPPDESPIIATNLEGRQFTLADISGSANLPTSAQGKNGKNGNHPEREPSADELENCVAPNPEITLAIARAALFTIDADVSRIEWVKCAAALRHQFSPHQDEEAFALFDEWSAKGAKYDGEKKTRSTWESLRQTTRGRVPVTIGTLVKKAEEAGWVDPRKEAKAKASATPPKAPLKVDGYYDSQKKEYLLCNEGGRWLSHAAEGFKRHLRKVGFSTKVPEGEALSPAEKIMDRIINQRDVRYAGPLAGRASGFYEEGGVRFLVTDSPILVEPVRGECPIILNLLEALVGRDPTHGLTQLATVLGWLKTGLEALRAGKRYPGQALALAGPVNCGKSLLQKITTELLGGRCAKAWRYMSGGTEFNGDLFGAEHLMLEDEQSTTDNRSRSNLAAHIKAIAVNEVHSCHFKRCDAVNLRPFWRMTISLNDEPEAMLVLPSMRIDLADKLILLQCALPPKPFPTGTHDLRSAYWQSIVAEIPAFAQYLLDYEIPEHLRDTRFGIRYFHHPELLESLRSLAPETKLLELIDRELFRERKTTWEGTAGELESLLRDQFSTVKEEASKLFHWSTACGVYLGKLVDKTDGRIRHKRIKERRLWVINPPGAVMSLDEY